MKTNPSNVRKKIEALRNKKVSKTTIYKLLGLNICYYRSSRGMTQAELAKKMGLTVVSIARIETAIRSTSLHQVYNFAKALDVFPSQLLDVFLCALLGSKLENSKDLSREIIKKINEINAHLDKEDKYLCACCFKIEPVDREEMQRGRIRYQELKPGMPIEETAFMCDDCGEKHKDFLKQRGYL